MRIAATALILTLPLILSACGRKDEATGPATPATGAATEAGTATTTPTRALSPVLKTGLWRVSMTGDGATMTSRMCVDAAMQERMNVIGAQQQAGACQQTTTSPVPGGFAFNAVCDSTATGGGKTTTTGQITGDMQTGYVNRMTSTSTGFPVAHMNRTSEMVAEGVYEGPCPSDMKPGDMEMPGGMRFNMLEMAAGAARSAKPAQ